MGFFGGLITFFFSFFFFLFFFLAYLIVIVIRGYIWPFKGMVTPGEIRLIHFTPDFVSTFPIQVFAYTCAQNVGISLLGVD